jgi:hypothetical protein
MPLKSRWARPHSTAFSTEWNTCSHEHRNASATSFQLMRWAHEARNHIYAFVRWFLPSAQGTLSTVTPHPPQSTRRIAYRKNTAIPHSGTNSNRRWLSLSYPGPFSPHPEHVGCARASGSSCISSTSGPFLAGTNSAFRYTKPGCFCTRFRIVFSCMPPSWLSEQLRAPAALRSSPPSPSRTRRAE